MSDHYKHSKIPTAYQGATGSVPAPVLRSFVQLLCTQRMTLARPPSRARFRTPWRHPLLHDFVLRRAGGKKTFNSYQVSQFWTNRCNKRHSYRHLQARLELRVLKARLFCAKAADIWKSLNIKIYSSVRTENNTYLTHDISLAFIQLESISS